MKSKILFVGGGTHARVMIDLIRNSRLYEIAGILDPNLEIGSNISNVSVLGDDRLLPRLYAEGIKRVCLGVGSIRNNSKRKNLYERIKKIGFHVPILIHPHAIVSKAAKISEGVQIMAGAIIQAGCSIGENTIINTGVIVEHDCKIGNHVHISSGTVISGSCSVGDMAFIGSGVTVIQEIDIGKASVVGAGSVVIRDVPQGRMC